MTGKEKLSKIQSIVKDNQDNDCPEKEGDRCKKPGVYRDSEPIGGGG